MKLATESCFSVDCDLFGLAVSYFQWLLFLMLAGCLDYSLESSRVF